jgi:hypothetical protein
MTAPENLPMKIFRLEPSAAAGDPNWDRAPSHGTIFVRAESPADARIVASGAEEDFLETDALPSHDKTTRFASAFRDDKLYSVSEADDGGYTAEGPREVVGGRISTKVITRS